MLPAPVFRVVAELQAVRRVGLTATLVREDGCEGYVFSLVGPKRYDVPWKELERDHWIASAECVEVRIDLPAAQEIDYAVAGSREKHKIASVNPDKLQVVRQIINHHPEDKILVIGQYLNQSLIHAEDEAKRMGDEYVSVEHLFLSMRTKGKGTVRPGCVRKVHMAVNDGEGRMHMAVSGADGRLRYARRKRSAPHVHVDSDVKKGSPQAPFFIRIHPALFEKITPSGPQPQTYGKSFSRWYSSCKYPSPSLFRAHPDNQTEPRLPPPCRPPRSLRAPSWPKSSPQT